MKKVLIFGFPHCGTTILKSIISHIDGVHELINEKYKIDENDVKMAQKLGKHTVVCKLPYFGNVFLTDQFKDYYKIFVVRNPVWVYSSLNKRFDITNTFSEKYKELETQASLRKWSDTARLFNWFRKGNQYNIITIKYEEFFENDFQNIKNILDKIRFEYTDDIFDNSKYKNYSVEGVEIPSTMPKNVDHADYRTWQINQKIENLNTPDKIFLLPHQISHFKNCRHTNILYPLERKINITHEEWQSMQK